MKLSVKIEFSGKVVVGFVPKLGGCYVQADKIQEIASLMKLAIEAYRENYKSRMEPFSPDTEHPKINHKIQFHTISSNQLGNIFRQYNYIRELNTNLFQLYRKGDFPFDRIVIPNSPNVSPLIVEKIFGSDNVIALQEEHNQLPISDQA